MLPDLKRLRRLESESIYILREAYRHFSPVCMLWSLGKDSGVLIHLAKKAFDGVVPFPVAHLDTGAEFPETYKFREEYTKKWQLNLIVAECAPIETIDSTLPPGARFAARKTAGLKQLLADHPFRGIVAGIRRDEQATRAKERVYSPRAENNRWDMLEQPTLLWEHMPTHLNQGAHMRVHPLLSWNELDIWHYIAQEQIELVPLYFSRNGERFRSLGEQGITLPIKSEASTITEIIAELSATNTDERSGRTMDHEAEDVFERLRTAGYM